MKPMPPKEPRIPGVRHISEILPGAFDLLFSGKIPPAKRPKKKGGK